MAEQKVVGVLLPTTAYVLRIQPPPARAMIDQGKYPYLSPCLTWTGVPVGLGSDFNPNAVSICYFAFCLTMTVYCITDVDTSIACRCQW
jgi:imidazolonepropionase